MKYIKTFERRYKQESQFEIPNGTKLICIKSNYNMFKVGDIVEMGYYKASGGGYYASIIKYNCAYPSEVIDSYTVKYNGNDGRAIFTTDASVEDYELKKATEKYNL